ncbi:hypothetical protein ETD83_26010 [Actinomadura soli]|uniref:Penicillin-binding protein transpeptidase domain-containing protein n=1 Tax=Actinomadura soli TaxID=2508997 RepID=A0A5C4J8B8_9ACTN|nr:penicillin-binding transpeptidase domain-containing protein [Actinomadura soli]TMQ93071.1 hypothetical protein ETD83_26010 [Actinomadura soli]
MGHAAGDRPGRDAGRARRPGAPGRRPARPLRRRDHQPAGRGGRPDRVGDRAARRWRAAAAREAFRRGEGPQDTAQRTIRNDEDHALGRTTLRGAFAASCNTTFSRLAVERLGAEKLAASARRFGFGARLAPGVDAADGSFPGPESGAELAEAAIGQGRVQASPLLMASVAAAAADGSWRSPRLLAPKLIREGGGAAPDPRPVPGASALRTMMRAVVTGGTAAGAGLPGGTAGKTGTAEIGGGRSHAWFIGYRDGIAFSVFVEAGGSGPKVAAPLAARFLKAMG